MNGGVDEFSLGSGVLCACACGVLVSVLMCRIGGLGTRSTGHSEGTCRCVMS